MSQFFDPRNPYLKIRNTTYFQLICFMYFRERSRDPNHPDYAPSIFKNATTPGDASSAKDSSKLARYSRVLARRDAQMSEIIYPFIYQSDH